MYYEKGETDSMSRYISFSFCDKLNIGGVTNDRERSDIFQHIYYSVSDSIIIYIRKEVPVC